MARKKNADIVLRPNTGAVRGFGDASELIENLMTTRSQMMRSAFDPKRDYNSECGYPETSELISIGPMGSTSIYSQMFDREAVAARVVEVLPEESWKKQPTVFETDDGEPTDFEKCWDALGRSLNGESWYQDELGNPIWEYLKRVDILSGVGSFGVLLIGIDDGKALSEPVDGFKDPKESPTINQLSTFLQEAYKARFSTNAAPVPPRKTEAEPDDGGNSEVSSVEGAGERDTEQPNDPKPKPKLKKDKVDLKDVPKTKRKLTYLRAFDESLVQITQFETNKKNPRYGKPVMYQITFNDPADNHGGIGTDITTQTVHWSRVIHVTETMKSNEVFGVPRMRPVLNRLIDLVKLYGGSAEMYWKGAFPGMSIETIPQLGGDVKIDPGMKDQVENYWNGLQRYMALSGMGAKMLSPTVVDPTAQIAAQIEAICIKLGIPKRIFMGSERGELSSGQDADTWNGRLQQRQTLYLTPRLIVPFVDRLIKMEVLPEPEGFSVEWPEPELAPADRATMAAQITTALAAYVAGGVNAMMSSRAYLVYVCGFDEDVVDAILEEAVEDAQDDELDAHDDPLKIAAIQQKEEQAQQAADQADLALQQTQIQADSAGQEAEAGRGHDVEMAGMKHDQALEQTKLKAKLAPKPPPIGNELMEKLQAIVLERGLL